MKNNKSVLFGMWGRRGKRWRPLKKLNLSSCNFYANPYITAALSRVINYPILLPVLPSPQALYGASGSHRARAPHSGGSNASLTEQRTYIPYSGRAFNGPWWQSFIVPLSIILPFMHWWCLPTRPCRDVLDWNYQIRIILSREGRMPLIW